MTLKSFAQSLSLVSIFCLLAGCAASTVTSDNSASSQAEISFDGLVKVKDRSVSDVWADPSFNPDDYSSITLRSVGIQYAPARRSMPGRPVGKGGFYLSEQQKAKVQNIVESEFREALSGIKSYDIVPMPQPKTLILLISVIDVESHVPNDTFRQHEVFLSDVGKATLVLEFVDAKTGATLVRVKDRKVAELAGPDLQRSVPIRNWRAVQKLAKSWAVGLQTGIDQMKLAAQ